MTQSAGATHIQHDYDTVRPDINAHISHFLTVPPIEATEDPLAMVERQKAELSQPHNWSAQIILHTGNKRTCGTRVQYGRKHRK